MAFLGGLLIFIGLAGLILGLVTLVKPIQRIRVTNRKRAAGVLGASFAVMIVGGLLTPTSKDSPARADAATPAATNTPKPTEGPKASATPKASEEPKDTATPKPTNTPKPTETPKPPTATPLPLTFEQQLEKSYRDNKNFISTAITDGLAVTNAAGIVTFDFYKKGTTPSSGELMDAASASGIVASKAIWSTYPDVTQINVVISADYLEKATGAALKQVAISTTVLRATGEKFVYDGLKNLDAQDNRTFLCAADHYHIFPIVYVGLSDPGCLSRWLNDK